MGIFALALASLGIKRFINGASDEFRAPTRTAPAESIGWFAAIDSFLGADALAQIAVE